RTIDRKPEELAEVLLHVPVPAVDVRAADVVAAAAVRIVVEADHRLDPVVERLAQHGLELGLDRPRPPSVRYLNGVAALWVVGGTADGAGADGCVVLPAVVVIEAVRARVHPGLECVDGVTEI